MLNILTPYAQGLVCKRFDVHDQYIVRLYGDNQWLVVKKSHLEEKHNDDENTDDENTQQLYFTRVSLVQIIDGFMSCTCGDVQQYLMPCRHIFAVIKKKEYIEPNFFHLRWNKHFAYFFNRDYGKTLAPNVTQVLNEIFESTTLNCFACSGSGRYKGVLVDNSKFYQNIKTDHQRQDDLSLSIMEKIRDDMINSVVMQRSITFQSFLNNENAVEEMEQDDGIIDLDEYSDPGGIAGSSQTEMQLTDKREKMPMSPNKTSTSSHSSVYSELLPNFENAVNTCKTDAQRERLQRELLKCYHSNIAENGARNRSINDQKYAFYGTDISNKKTQPRKKLRYENQNNVRTEFVISTISLFNQKSVFHFKKTSVPLKTINNQTKQKNLFKTIKTRPGY